MSGNWWKPTAGGGGTPTDTQPPTAPANLSAAASSSSQINLSWSASTDNIGVTGYQIFRSGSQVGTSTGTSYSDTGLSASTAYSYTVKAVDAAGNVSGNSNTASATTASGPVSSNLALNRPAVASSIEGTGFEAGKATDSNSSTRWASIEGSNNEWIYVDLGSSKNVNRVKLNWEAAYGKSYKIQVSTNTSSWTDAYSTTTGDGGIDDVSFAAKTGRYVRILCSARGTSYGYSLYDFEVYGS
ncbi:discoidin domain-containing protein [Paenibacillus sp. NPDC058071]|uniref:discoidin domain-containing protein n=1 Tax=Paenibacillus sp. NPDC058071 TaxID=3346326 RepID=UPI0036DA7F06